MKPAAFDYAAPGSLDEAVALLARNDGAKLIAGGQSLLPLLNFRLAAPTLLVDLRHVPGLDGIAIDESGIRLGAKVRWCDIERDMRLHAAHPLLAAAIAQVAHYQVRNRGTIGGSLAHADPAAELPGIAVACDATIAVVGPAGERRVPADAFLRGPLETALASDEIIVALHLPPWSPGRRWAFEEFSRRRGDFALAGVAVHYALDDRGRATDMHVGTIGLGLRPTRLAAVEALLDCAVIDEAAISAASRAAPACVTPFDDLQGSADYRRALLSMLLERCLHRAAHAD